MGAQDRSIGPIYLSNQFVDSIVSVTIESNDRFNNLSATAAPIINQPPIQFLWHQPHPKTKSSHCKLSRLPVVFYFKRISYEMKTYDLSSATWHLRPTVCYVLSSTSNMGPRVVAWRLCRILVTTDYWTSHASTRTMNFVCCALRYHPYWLLKLLCFFLILQEHILLLFHVFHIRWRPHHDYHHSDRLSSQKVSVATSDELTTIFLHQRISIRTRDVTKRRFSFQLR